MNGLFCFDGPMYCDINGVYCNTTLTNTVFDRYLKVVDSLTIAVRTFNLEDTYADRNLNKLNMDNLIIIETENLNSLKGILCHKSNTRKKLVKLVEESDLIFARMPSILSNMVIEIAKELNKPYLVEVGGCVFDSYWNHSLKGKIMAPYLFHKTKEHIFNAEYAVYVTENFLQKRYPTKAITESCSNVVLQKSNELFLKKRLVKILNKNINEPFVIGTTAAVDVKYKGQELIIEAIAILKKEGYSYVYELVGSGNVEYLKRKAEKLGVLENVKFLGTYLQTEVIVWLDKIDLYAQPSKQEGLPRALIEAMSRGCPSIGARTAGIPELLSDEVVFDNGNIKQICEILRNMSKSKMISLAEINFLKSKEFDPYIIEKRRKKIFEMYSDSVKKNKIKKGG